MTNGSEPRHGATSVARSAQNMGLFRDLRLGAAGLSRRVDRRRLSCCICGTRSTFRTDLDFSALMKDARYVSLTTIVTNVILVALSDRGRVWIARWRGERLPGD